MKKAKGYTSDTDLTADDLKTLVRAVQGQGQGSPRQGVPRRPDGAALGRHRRRVQASGTASAPSPTAGSRGSRTSGAPPSTCRRWCSATWATPRPPAWPSPATRPPARTSSTASGWSTPRARTWWPASAPRTRSTRRPRTSRTSTCRRSRPRCPSSTSELDDIRDKLEKHYNDMQDIEFTIQEGTLYMLQCRVGKRTGTAALNMAMDMLAREADRREDRRHARRARRSSTSCCTRSSIPTAEKERRRRSPRACRPVPAAPCGADRLHRRRTRSPGPSRARRCILVREETNPEDVEGMRAADGILTARGGMTSPRGARRPRLGQVLHRRRRRPQGRRPHEDDPRRRPRRSRKATSITLNGTRGHVYAGALAMMDATENPRFQRVHEARRQVSARWACAPTPTRRRTPPRRASSAPRASACSAPSTCSTARARDQPLFLLRKMIVSSNDGRASARPPWTSCSRSSRRDIKATLEAMDGLPVTIRLLDPPLHEFVPQGAEEQAEAGQGAGHHRRASSRSAADGLHETNPMMGHRGVRLGITYPEVTRDADPRHLRGGRRADQGRQEGASRRSWSRSTCDGHGARRTRSDRRQAGLRRGAAPSTGVAEIPHLYGTMIEIPRAALPADKMAKTAEFFSFGTNDLTQMTLRLQPRRHRRLPARLPRARRSCRPTRSRRSTRRASASSIEMAVEQRPRPRGRS